VVIKSFRSYSYILLNDQIVLFFVKPFYALRVSIETSDKAAGFRRKQCKYYKVLIAILVVSYSVNLTGFGSL